VRPHQPRAAPGTPAAGLTGSIRADVEALVRRTQDEICAAIEDVEGAPFREDVWARAEGGGGRTRVLQGGRVFEKAGVNVSTVHGMLPAPAVAQMRARGNSSLSGSGPFPFFACGISLVLHPTNPRAPTVHANYRYFEVSVPDASIEGGQRKVWWYGGGADLTPCVLYPEDAAHFHAVLKAACDGHDATFYPRFKRWCDSYFYIPHRGERRGVGGIFFDDLDCATRGSVGSEFLTPADERKTGDVHMAPLAPGGGDAGSPYALLPFMSDLARSFLPAYIPILNRRKDEPFTAAQKEWQQLRRGRYVEFNLVHDRGTKFGLATPGARIESILMSLPLTARWEYGHVSAEGSEEAELLRVLKTPVDWVPLQ
jgi:coproporphyrinogen III oxidase